MVSFPPEINLILLVIAGAAIMAILGTLASLVRNSTALHDLTVSAAHLRINYAKQLAREEEGEIIEVDEVAEANEASAGTQTQAA